MTLPLRIVQYGLGPIGQDAAGTVLEKQDAGRMELVGTGVNPGYATAHGDGDLHGR